MATAVVAPWRDLSAYLLRGIVTDEAAGPDTIDWAAVRTDYHSARESIVGLCRRYGLIKANLLAKAAEEGWKRRRHKTPERRTIISRMFRLLDRQIIELEENMTDTGDKEVAVLGRLVSTLGKLIDIENAEVNRPARVQGKDMHELRNRLAERIEQLKRA